MNREVQRLFEAALKVPEDGRRAFLESQTSDAAIRREVLSLVAHDALAEQLFEEAIQSEASSLCSSLDLAPGAVIGQYRIVSLLGRGGMGAVYLAERADRSFEQRVAIKVIQPAGPTEFLLERFQQERRILANLSHSNIASLFDGGEGPNGFPYFVMEYVKGKSIDALCDQSSLSLADRLRLFLKVCDAVRYAHQNLIVHRDLKPANILVTAEGQPKLLDFGIAKVLDPADTGLAQTSTRVLTPEYASPEQVRGEPITTATDIYSLAAVLARILTGKPPRALAGLSPLEAAHAIAEGQPLTFDELPADVNAILKKALHRDPLRRYRSVEELAGDISRFLEGRAVLAAPDSWGYRARKFLRRNWVTVGAVAAVFLALTSGAGVALWQARRAERRFGEVRQLANTFLFDFENAIHNVSGATNARLLVVKTAGEYLARLSAEAGGDRVLVRELADSYKKLGDVQGAASEGNVGQLSAALASYQKGLTLRDSIGDQNASDPKARLNYLLNLNALANLVWVAGDRENATGLASKSVAMAERWVASSRPDADLLAVAAAAYGMLGDVQRYKEDHTASQASYKRRLELQTRAYQLEPSNPARLAGMASAYRGLGYGEMDGGKPAAAMEHFKRGTQLLEQALVADPKNASLRRALMKLVGDTGTAIKQLKARDHSAVADALPYLQRAYMLGNDLVTEDPANQLVQGDLAGICQLYGSTLQEAGKAAEALPLLERGIEIFSRQLKTTPGDVNTAFNLAIIRVWTSDCRRDLHDLTGALQESKMAGEIWDRLLALRPGTFRYLHQKADNLNTMGNLLAARGDIAGARACFREGLAIAEKLPQQDAGFSTSVLFRELRQSEKKLPRAR
ncbi:MAG TPA: serine/threonine-protein kinase [Bryobacteraceae bacterium]|nr:serine/threonine-protein kinase [Bryobacteraceae bacterium]